MGTSGGGSQAQSMGSMNPVIGLLLNAFNVPTRTDVGGGGIMAGDAPYQGGAGFQFTDPLFGPRTFDPLGNLFDPISFGDQGLDTGGLINRTAGQQQELAQTGFKTDISPAVDLSQRLFEEEFIPGAMEQFGGLGLNPGDTDFTNAMMREGSRRATELGALDIDLSEAAAGRRMAGMQSAPGLLDLQNLGLTTEFAGTDAGQIFNILSSIGGIGTQAGVSGGGSNESSKGWGWLS